VRKPYRGFTILELIVVIIIIGVLATLGSSKYASVVERSRGAEAKEVCGLIRKHAQAKYLEHQSIQNPLFTDDDANIGIQNDQHPLLCRPSHYFRYNIDVLADNRIRVTATRCRNNGKQPDYPVGCGAQAPTYILTADLDTGENDIQSDGY
jgi:prepilin-type N-terminal cleavage/methylation domain-containing protein